MWFVVILTSELQLAAFGSASFYRKMAARNQTHGRKDRGPASNPHPEGVGTISEPELLSWSEQVIIEKWNLYLMPRRFLRALKASVPFHSGWENGKQ
jgi:hypothetical protein